MVRSGFGIFYAFPDSNTINNTVATIPFIAAATVTNDRPPVAPTRTWADFFLGQPNVVANTSGAVCPFGYVALSCSTPSVDSGSIVFKSEAIDEWNFAVQRQLTENMSLDVAYVGNKTSHLNQNLSINDPAPGAGQIQPRRPYAQWGPITYPVFSENANYNALQVKYESRNYHGLTTLVSYAWSKCIDSGTQQSGTTLLLLSSNRGPCDYDLPQTLTTSFDYSLPFGKGKKFLGNSNRLLDGFVGGWEATGIVTLRSGLPFTPTISSDTANTGVTGQRPQVIGTPDVIGAPSCWFYVAANKACTTIDPSGTSAFTTPGAFTYGNGGRNTLRAQWPQRSGFQHAQNNFLRRNQKAPATRGSIQHLESSNIFRSFDGNQ